MSKAKTKMREIKLLTVEQEGENAKPIKYYDLIENVLHAPKDPTVGTTTKEMRKVSPILNRLKKVGENGTLHLQEDHWVEIKDRVAAYKFAVNTDLIIDFEDAILEAKEVPFEKSDESEE